MKNVIALSLLLLFATAAAHAGGTPSAAPAAPVLASSSAQGPLVGPQTPSPAFTGPSLPSALPVVLATDFSARLGSCGAKSGAADKVTRTAGEIPPILDICCDCGGSICCPRKGTCVSCGFLCICCNP